MNTRLTAFFVAVWCWIASPALSQSPPHSLAKHVTIYRDTWGIPHVFGETDAATVFGFAYAQAEDNFFQVEDNYIRAIGRRTEVSGESGITGDRRNHALEIPKLARAEYQHMPASMRALLDAFVDGFNYYLATHPEVKPHLLSHFEPWYPLAFIRYNYYQNGFFWSAGFRPDDLQLAADESLTDRKHFGSNGWVIGPSKSTTGHAMLFINPHLPFFGSGQVYEGHLKSGQGWNFTGYTRFGFPFPYVGHNETLGWVSTDNSADQADLYIETFDDAANPLAYRHGNGYRTAISWTDTILVKTPGGMERRTLALTKTHHGPIMGRRDGKPLALHMAKIEADGWLQEWYDMTRARNVTELKNAMRPLNMLFGNVMAADAQGNTWYLYNSAVPMRDARIDFKGLVDGSDPATDWRGYHTIEELPELTNPATGWMQNCNTTPFLLTSVGNPDPARFPKYMVTDGDNPRGMVSRAILGGTPKFSWQDWVRVGFDTRVISPDSLLPGLLRDFQKSSDTRLAEAIDTLRRWSRRSDITSVAMTVFDRWLEAYGAGIPNVPALDSALTRLERVWGNWRVQWGDVNRLQRIDESADQEFSDARPSIPVRGVAGQNGAVFTFYAGSVRGQKRRYGQAGGTYVSVVEFGPTVRALGVHTMGESGNPKSPHYFDQAPYYARGEFLPRWFTLAEIKAHLERAYRP